MSTLVVRSFGSYVPMSTLFVRTSTLVVRSFGSSVPMSTLFVRFFGSSEKYI